MQRNMGEKGSILSQTIKTIGSKAQGEEKYSCRICFEGNYVSEEKSSLISPCQCKGSLKYVHSSCLAFWIGKRKNLTELKTEKDEISCELCKTTIQYEISTTTKCNGCQKVVRKAVKKPFFSALCLILFGVLLSFLALMILLLVQMEGLIKILYVCLGLLSLLMLGIYCYFLLKIVLLKKEIKDIRIYQNENS